MDENIDVEGIEIPTRFELPGFRYYQEHRRCNKEGCTTCAEDEGHGPYWFSYDQRGVRTYLGRELPERVIRALQWYSVEGERVGREMRRFRDMHLALKRLYYKQALLPGDLALICEAGFYTYEPVSHD